MKKILLLLAFAVAPSYGMQSLSEKFKQCTGIEIESNHAKKGLAYFGATAGLLLALNRLESMPFTKMKEADDYLIDSLTTFMLKRGWIKFDTELYWGTALNNAKNLVKKYTLNNYFNFLAYPVLLCVYLPLAIKGISHLRQAIRFAPQEKNRLIKKAGTK